MRAATSFMSTTMIPIDFPDVPDKSRTVTRGIPYVALDWRWPFVSESRSGNSYVLEPLAQLIAQPYGGNPAGLPNEDTDAFEFDDNNLFSVNQLPGYDLVESGPRANVGFIADAMFKGGEVQGLVGQTYRLKPDPIFANLAGENGTASDVVGRVSLKFPHLDFTDRLDFDRGNGTRQASRNLCDRNLWPLLAADRLCATAGGSAEPGPAHAASRSTSRATSISTRTGRPSPPSSATCWPARCSIPNMAWAMRTNAWRFRVAYRRKYTFDAIQGVPPSTSVVLRFSLKTGDQPVQPFSLFPQNVFATSHP